MVENLANLPNSSLQSTTKDNQKPSQFCTRLEQAISQLKTLSPEAQQVILLAVKELKQEGWHKRKRQMGRLYKNLA